MRLRNNIMILLFFNLFSVESSGQSPSWPISSTVSNYNQINCTFTEKHSAFHGALDLHIANNEKFLAILPGIVEEDASTLLFMRTRHDFQSNTDINSNLKKVRYGDDTDPLSGIIGINNSSVNYSTITLGQEIGKIVSQNHLHFEMWTRDCSSCDWYLVDPLNNSYQNYQNQPPGYNDIYDVELNDVILEPQDANSGIIFNPGNGLTEWHYNSCKIHKKDRPDSQGVIHTYNSTNITVFGNILPTIHVRDIEVTNGTNSTGEGLGIYECTYYIDDELKYWLKFDKIQEIYKQEWDAFFNHKYNTASGYSVLYGNHDYIKMHRLITDQYCAPHKSTGNGIWKTRALQGDANQIANISQNAQYVDGYYDVDFHVFDAAENMDEASNRIIIDNFLPYIKKVTLSDSEGIFYEGEWNLNSMQNALEFQYCSTGADSRQGFDIEVESSEPINNLSLTINPDINNVSLIPNSNKTIWAFSFANSLNSYVYDLVFAGIDFANNKLLTNPQNLYYRTGDDEWFSETSNQSVSGDLENLGITGTDTIHQINLPEHLSENCTINGASCTGLSDPTEVSGTYQLPDNTGQETFNSSYRQMDVKGYICDNQDIDRYTFSTTKKGELYILLNELPANYELELYEGSSNSPVAYSIYTGTSGEVIIFNVDTNSTIDYTIAVFGNGYQSGDGEYSSTSKYNLEVAWIPDDPSWVNLWINTAFAAPTTVLTVCENIPTQLQVTLAQGCDTNVGVTWIPSDGLSCDDCLDPIINIDTDKVYQLYTYSLNSTDANDIDSACFSVQDVSFNVASSPTANAGNNVTIQSGGSTQLQGSGSSSCSWSPATGLSNANSCTPTASPSQTTTYTLTVTENDCTDTDTVTITVNGSNGNPPTNDDCSDATTLTSNTSCSYVSGTVADATPSFGANLCDGCSCTSPDDYDVYYKFTAVETSHTVTVSNYASNFDAVIELRTGCSSGSSNYISCFDPSGAPSSVSKTWTGLTVGQTYYIRVFEWGYQQSPPDSDTFDICVTHQSSNTDGIDLISDITSVSNDNPDAGDQITVNYTVKNNGDETMTGDTTSALYLSTNQSYDSSDILITGSVYTLTTNLSPNQSINLSPSVTLPNVSDGQYYIISYPDLPNLITESDNDNNTDAYAIQIGNIVTNGPNLDVRRAIAVPDNGLVPGQEVELEIRIENDGNEDSNSFDVLVYLDIDEDGNPDSNEVMGEFAFSSLDADEDITVFEDFNLPANIPSEGSYDLYVLADSNNDINETNENDNDKRDNVTIVLVNNDAENDVVVLNQAVNNTNVNTGQNVDVTVDHVYLGNNTTDDLPSISLGYYLSTDCNLSIDDILLDDETSNIGINKPVQDEDETLTIPVGTSTGTYYILFVADNEYDIDEGDFEDNNVECVEINVTNNTTPVGDITVVDGSCLPENIANNNETFLLTNIGYSGGQIDANSYKVHYYFSTDCVLSDDDVYLDDDNASLSSDNTISSETSALILPSNLQVGTYYILILADAENELYETNEDNNIGCIEFNIVSTDTNYQDVTLSNPYVASTEANIGDAIPISIYQNYTGYQSEDEIGGIAVHYYLSTDCELSSDDHYFDDDNSVIGNDDSSDKETYTMTVPDGISTGQYYVLFVADALNVVTENNEDNNIECVPITINETLSIDDNELNEKIKIYPNPVSDILTINLGEIHSKINLEVFNVLGQKVNSLTFDQKQIVTIDTNSLSIGIYIFKLKTESINSVEFKVIKE